MVHTNDFRTMVQSKLSSISNLECGEIIGDDLIKEDVYYFGYKLNTTGNRFNLDYSNKRQTYTIMGYLSTKGGKLSTMDELADNIVSKLEQLKFLCSVDDISTLDTKVRKMMITGTVRYDYLDGLLK